MVKDGHRRMRFNWSADGLAERLRSELRAAVATRCSSLRIRETEIRCPEDANYFGNLRVYLQTILLIALLENCTCTN